MKLPPKILRNKADGSVLRRTYLVPLVVLQRSSLTVPHRRRQGNVKVYGPADVIIAVHIPFSAILQLELRLDQIRICPTRLPLLLAGRHAREVAIEDGLALLRASPARHALRRPSQPSDRIRALVLLGVGGRLGIR